MNFGDNVKIVFPALGKDDMFGEEMEREGHAEDTSKGQGSDAANIARESSRTSGEECDVQDCLES